MDIYGQALSDFYHYRIGDKLFLHNNYGPVEEMPVAHFFRSESEMPALEIYALEFCQGKILDIGAGVGSHSLVLQDRGKDVTALEISPGATDIMKKRGVEQIINGDIFHLKGKKYHTLLLLMNGIGLVGDLGELENFFDFAQTILHPEGILLFDSSDIMYLYEGSKPPKEKYYGEIAYQYEYKKVKGNWFNWLYIDPRTLAKIAAKKGWQCQIAYEDGLGQFLAGMRPR